MHSFFHKVAEFRIELILFCFCFANALGNTGFGNLTLQKLCFPDGPPGSEVICKNDKAHEENAFYSSCRSTIREVLPGVVVLFAGSWRDYTGLSRPLAIIANAGEFVSALVGLASAFFWDLHPAFAVFADCFLSGLTGSRALLVIAIFTYITDRTSTEERTTRMAFLLGAILGSFCIGSAAGGFILAALSYKMLFALVASLFAFNIFMCWTIQDGLRRNVVGVGGPFESVKKLKVVFQPKDNTVTIWLCIVGSAIYTALLNSEESVATQFRQKTIGLSPTKVGLFGAFRMAVSILVCAIMMPIVTRVCKINEFLVAFCGSIPSAVSCFLTAFATTETQLYIYASFDMMRIMIISILSAMVTKIVPKTETGVYMSFLSTAEAFTPLALNPIYYQIYKATKATLPGAFYIVSGCVVCGTAVLIATAACMYKKPDDSEDDKTIVDEKSIDEKSVDGKNENMTPHHAHNA